MCRDVASQHMKVKNTQLSHCFGISFRPLIKIHLKNSNLNDVNYELQYVHHIFLNIAIQFNSIQKHLFKHDIKIAENC
jgi:hypothetical protein